MKRSWPWEGILTVAAVSVALVACGEPATPEQQRASRIEAAQTAAKATADIRAVDIGGRPFRCIPGSEISVNDGFRDLRGDVRRRFLTPEADAAGVRVLVSSTEVTGYGSTVVRYLNQEGTCLLWAETLSIQEYAEKMGLTPIGVANGYAVGNTQAPAPSSNSVVSNSQ